MMMFSGMRILFSEACTRTIYDYSRCRSPARAKRRAMKGPQHTQVHIKPVAIAFGDTMLCHPSFRAGLVAACQKLGPDEARL